MIVRLIYLDFALYSFYCRYWKLEIIFILYKDQDLKFIKKYKTKFK